MNRELIEKTIQHIVDHPEQHNQGAVFNECGTPACFVGWAMHFSGLDAKEYYREIEGDSIEWASENLGINIEDACTIFSSHNTIPMLQLMVKDVLNETPLGAPHQYRREAHG